MRRTREEEEISEESSTFIFYFFSPSNIPQARIYASLFSGKCARINSVTSVDNSVLRRPTLDLFACVPGQVRL